MLVSVLSLALTAVPADAVRVWIRGPDGPAVRAEDVGVRALPVGRHTLFDVQYGKKMTYASVPLTKLIEKVRPEREDLALLHFSNGMLIPVPIDEAAKVHVASSIIEDGKSRASFPPIRRTSDDPRPIEFERNKVVVQDAALVMADREAGAGFSPWRFVDSLIGVELVRSKKYYERLRGPARVAAGFAVYQRACQFCHGVRGVGAHFGWDFVDPVPIHTYRKSPGELLFHVRHRVSDAARRGIMMPALKHLGEGEIAELWSWLNVAASRTMPDYR